MYPDGRRASDVDLGQLGGKTVATARFEGDTLTTYLRKKGKLFMTAKRTIRAGIYILIHVAEYVVSYSIDIYYAKILRTRSHPRTILTNLRFRMCLSAHTNDFINGIV